MVQRFANVGVFVLSVIVGRMKDDIVHDGLFFSCVSFWFYFAARYVPLHIFLNPVL